ncbi:MAG: DUF2860 domain-containing protein [Desulfobacterales bacterium]|nr:DUF2860 domain-containing protein [Desulfobacterales bacterium]
MGSLKGWIIVLILILFPLPVLAGQTQENENQGFFGSVFLGGGVAAGNPSGLKATDDNKRISSLNKQSGHQQEIIPLIMGEFGYSFASTGTKISLTNQKSEKSYADLVLEQSLKGLGTVSFSFGYGKEDVWADPYITGVDRREVDEESYNLALEWQEIIGSGFSATLKMSSVEVDKDLIGDRYYDLRRDGEIMMAGIEYLFPLGKNQVIIPGFNLEREDRDGESNSCKKAGISLAHIIEFGRWNFTTSLGVGRREFDKSHPVFHKTREETQYEFSHLVTYSRPFGWEGCFIHGLLAYSRADANINFFNQDELTIGTGIGYKF